MPKSAFVALIGRPSVGKSTLVNLLCGEKVAIVSDTPQTTRNAVRGILTCTEGQLVFIDTPGRHISEKKLNKKLMEVADRALAETEIILYVLDAGRCPGPEEIAVAEKLKGYGERIVAVINKTDVKGANPKEIREFLVEFLPDLPPSLCFEISCLKKEGIKPLLDCLFKMAPDGEPLYPGDYYTDQDMVFRISEIIREKAINRLKDELPHSIYVDVADLEFRGGSPGVSDPHSEEIPAGKKRLWIRAFIITERESQKGIVVGKGGEMIKAIGQAARKELNSIFDFKVDLDLRVKTGKDWRQKDHVIRKITGF
ncbi:MAG: GTPase Era [Treponema sp.]|nr:GTPase Era [Treponema sp.]